MSSFPSLNGIDASGLRAYGCYVLSFGDIRDAQQASVLAKFVGPEWDLVQLTPKRVAWQQGRDCEIVSDWEGQVIVTVFSINSLSSASPILAEPAIKILTQMLGTFGEVKAMHSLPTIRDHVRDFRVEFYDTRAADEAVKSLHHSVVAVRSSPGVLFSLNLAQDYIIGIEHFTPDLAKPALSSTRPKEQLSITGRSTVPMDSEYDCLMQNLHMDDGYSFCRPSPHADHNRVDIARIQAGLDVRTTVCLSISPSCLG